MSLITTDDKLSSDNFIDSLKDKELIIYENIQGSKIYVNYTGERFIIKAKSLKSDELSMVDLAIQKYYNSAYLFFNTLPRYITDLLNKNFWFCFEYLPDMQVANIKYDKIPLNNLILTSIVKGGKHKFNYDEILEYSKLMCVDSPYVIFKGKLNNKQLEVINLYLKTSEDDLKFVFGEENFAKFFFNILNPNINNSFLMKDGEYNCNLEKIIIRVDGDDRYTFAILNPLYQRHADENQTEHSQVFSLIIMNFLEFLQLTDLKKIKITGLTNDEIYINLISVLFNDYIYNMKDDINSWDIFIPKFIKDDKFKINIDLIRNKDTQKLIKSSEKIEYIYKVILGSFKKYRKKPIGIMKESTVDLFNNMVKKISDYIDNSLSINRDYIFQKVDLLNFNDYFKIDFDRDAAGEIYPDITPHFDSDKGGTKKNGKKK